MGVLTGVALLRDEALSPLEVEFHVSQDNSQRSGAARIHHCLLRVLSNDVAQRLMKGFQSTGDTFVHFAYLETVVLETSYKLKIDDIQSLTEVLRRVCRAEVQHRTFEEGHTLALHVKKGGADSSRAGILSPFWCLDRGWWHEW